MNSLFLAIADYSNVDSTGALVSEGSWRNTLIARSEIVFTTIFTMECVLKIIALGFRGKTGYLADPWNWLDFVVVITGFASDPLTFCSPLYPTDGFHIFQGSRTSQ